MHLQFRNYRPTDRDVCTAVFRTNVPRFFHEDEFNDFLQFIDTSGCPYFVVVSEAALLGCGGFGIRSGSDTADLCWGMVDARQHRRHIGEFLLLARLYKIVSETNSKFVRLGTSQLTAGFFQRFGFTTQSHMPDGIAKGLDDVQMHLRLTDDIRASIQRRWQECTR
ncbi:GNAT family N-acetyltransferase [Stieleria mannarensis]|uniref:GNAT family N-acetyltransferase n=1 Tax=Stieleria mannarensis TaxID=2755585 RepID=UPI0016025AF9|nr:GNAT family N-acetyltransferase [Rhodopirellula sp. JC639]